MLAVVLEEGFDGDEVAVRVGDDVAFSSDSVTTCPQIGVAQRFTVDVPPGPADPDRRGGVPRPRGRRPGRGA